MNAHFRKLGIWSGIIEGFHVILGIGIVETGVSLPAIFEAQSARVNVQPKIHVIGVASSFISGRN